MPKNIFKDEKGSVALIVGIALVLVLFGVLSLTIDLNRTQSSYADNQGATDAAALSTAEFILKGITNQIGVSQRPFDWRPSDDELKAYAQKTFLSNFSTDQTSAIFDPSSLRVEYTSSRAGSDTDRDYKITVTACADLDTKIANAAGHADRTRTCTTSNAGFSLKALDNVEVAFALDFTNSMYMRGITTNQFPPYSDTKAKKMVDAMNYVFDTYFPAANSVNSDVYGSIVPFTGQVNLYPYNAAMVERNTALPTLVSASDPSYYPEDNINYDGADLDPNHHQKKRFFTHYPPQLAYTLDRIPSFNASKYNDIISSDNPSNLFPFKSFRSVFDNLPATRDSGTPEQYNQDKMYCYNRSVISSLDQRAENEMGIVGNNGIIQTPNININRYVLINRAGNENCSNVPIPAELADTGVCTRGSCSDLDNANNDPSTFIKFTCNLRGLNGGRINELHQSFPVQPLTNNTELLKNVVNAYVSNTTSDRLYPTNGLAESTITDFQGSRLNKANAINGRFGTSSVHGLLWSWLTINNNLDGDWWRDKSLYENYYPSGSTSQSSRTQLPSPNNKKYIILITDGNDNDGTDGTTNPSPTYRNTCDAYEPRAPFTVNQYVGLCSKIKGDDVKIHTTLYDFTPPAGRNKYQECATSTSTYHENVTPDQLKTIMDDIFRAIILDLTQVSIVK